MLVIIAGSVWKAFARISVEMSGFDPKIAFAMRITPGFWLLKAARATAEPFPIFCWKWMRPTGNTNTSPLFMVLVMRRFSGMEVTKPTRSVPSRTVKISVARGCVWGGLMPCGAKSMRTREMPRVLSPGIWATLTGVAWDPTGLFTAAATFNPLQKKSLASTSLGSLQTRPFTFTVSQWNKHHQYWHPKIDAYIYIYVYLECLPGLLRSATQKSWSGLGSDAHATQQVIARKVRNKSGAAMMSWSSQTLGDLGETPKHPIYALALN